MRNNVRKEGLAVSLTSLFLLHSSYLLIVSYTLFACFEFRYCELMKAENSIDRTLVRVKGAAYPSSSSEYHSIIKQSHWFATSIEQHQHQLKHQWPETLLFPNERREH